MSEPTPSERDLAMARKLARMPVESEAVWVGGVAIALARAREEGRAEGLAAAVKECRAYAYDCRYKRQEDRGIAASICADMVESLALQGGADPKEASDG